MSSKLDTKELSGQLLDVWQHLRRYRVVLFVGLLAIVYGFLIIHINSFNNAQPSASSSSKTVAVPHIDKTVVAQLQQLQDNSVSVKALFDEARSNPFQE